MAYKIEYTERLDGSDAMPFVIDAYVSLRNAGNTDPNGVPASGEEEAFYIRNRLNRIVAVLSFFKNSDSDDELVVNMGFVEKAYRKKGLYRLLWDLLVAEGRERGMTSIIGYHKPGNDAILAFNKKIGRRIKYVCSEFLL